VERLTSTRAPRPTIAAGVGERRGDGDAGADIPLSDQGGAPLACHRV
jgi:hypothetical protein